MIIGRHNFLILNNKSLDVVLWKDLYLSFIDNDNEIQFKTDDNTTALYCSWVIAKMISCRKLSLFWSYIQSVSS